MSGKVFHTKHYKRQPREKYYTPGWVTDILVTELLKQARLRYGDMIWEPAAGNGDIAKALADNWYLPTYASDIDPDNPQIERRNFLTTPVVPRPAGAIISNPPFGAGGAAAFQFCWHALRLMEHHNGLVAMLLRDDFDSAPGRKELFQHPAWGTKLVIWKRIRWVNLEQKANGPSGAHAWYIWDWTRPPGPPIIKYKEGPK